MENAKTRIDRRAFLKGSCKITAGLALAFNFGCSIRKNVQEEKSISLVYATRYGSTYDTATWIKNGIGSHVSLVDLETADLDAVLAEDALFILGSGIWTGGVHPKLKELARQEAGQGQQRVIGSFVVCGTPGDSEQGRQRIADYLAQIHRPLGYAPQFSRSFGGRLVVEKLNHEDKEALIRFYRTYMNQELASWDRTEPAAASAFGTRLDQALAEKIPTQG
ncbi:MAG: hypothetical protein D3908_01720 [Candidatus Electrothrix sp. AUS4]|nr:hypothetical protein [Candidatus Electrothrix sp. AUS4]